MIERVEFFFIIPANVTLEKMIGKIQIGSLKTQGDYLYLLYAEVCITISYTAEL